MNREFLTDEDIHALDEDSEIIVLQNKLDKANERIEELESQIKLIKNYAQENIKFNNRILEDRLTIYEYMSAIDANKMNSELIVKVLSDE